MFWKVPVLHRQNFWTVSEHCPNFWKVPEEVRKGPGEGDPKSLVPGGVSRVKVIGCKGSRVRVSYGPLG